MGLLVKCSKSRMLCKCVLHTISHKEQLMGSESRMLTWPSPQPKVPMRDLVPRKGGIHAVKHHVPSEKIAQACVHWGNAPKSMANFFKYVLLYDPVLFQNTCVTSMGDNFKQRQNINRSVKMQKGHPGPSTLPDFGTPFTLSRLLCPLTRGMCHFHKW